MLSPILCQQTVPSVRVATQLLCGYIRTVKLRWFVQAFTKCTAEVDPVVIASIPDIPQCIAALKEDFRLAAEYSPDTGKFVVEGSFEQVTCGQVCSVVYIAY